jgi:hypothetical protein
MKNRLRRNCHQKDIVLCPGWNFVDFFFIKKEFFFVIIYIGIYLFLLEKILMLICSLF